ncbi:cyclin-dependent kinase G-2 isoform X2 [Beta vulgaris subsp. vulgaris]|uniref:cyclin-dependent kinase G-2 isoform X2 n=1 Tax=Beta vulgaris subsp. vulgaris TaxID=3555 RepID=UPI00053F5134|nr:cyclin-dependent kinase G-2 isoform X2 [Beta vulgaris subsp. vulgaris]
MAAGKVSASRRENLSHVSRKASQRCVFDDEDIRVGGKEVMDSDDGAVLLPPQKRRKFSPVMLDEEDIIHSCSTQEINLDDDHEPGQIHEEDFTRAPNILMSRWACDDDLEDYSREEKGRGSSPESGVTQKEGSDNSGSRCSGSDEECVLRSYSEVECSESDLENDERMELDDSEGYDLVSDEDSMARVSGVGRRNMLQGCRSVFDYEKLGKISEGSYGIVYKARDKESGEMVALKKMKMGNQREGFPVCYLREINTLMSMNHPSIVNVREVVVDDSVDGFDSIYMVMDYVEHDLKLLMQSRKQPFRQSEVKCLMLQLLEGVKYLHDNWVLHRDLKTSNLLLNNKGELKICDFGMSRQYGSPLKPYTALVVTLWYRAPELLLGAKGYSTALDMWSVGCIMAELLTNKPLFDGKTEFEQLDKIFRTLGTPNEKIWPGYSQLPGVRLNFVNQPYNQLHKKFPRASFTDSPALSDLGLDLLSRLLTYDPEKRITSNEALNHPWFQEVPLPNSREFMPSFSANKYLCRLRLGLIGIYGSVIEDIWMTIYWMCVNWS